MSKKTFGTLFKKHRLKAEFSSLTEFGKVLGEYGYIYDDSIFYHWQRDSRIPKNRDLILTIISIFSERESITSLREINQFLESAGLGYATETELKHLKYNSASPQRIPHTKAVEFMEMIGKSKLIPRTGWVMSNIKNPESVAEHSFRVSIMAMAFADHLGVDRDKLIQMALLHDLGEIITGDIVWSRGGIIDIKKRAEKEQLEKDGIEKIFKLLGQPREYKKLFEEMIERRSVEANIFWQLDKLEMAMQALEYEKSNNEDLEEFFLTADAQITTPFIKTIMKSILKQRPLYHVKHSR